MKQGKYWRSDWVFENQIRTSDWKLAKHPEAGQVASFGRRRFLKRAEEVDISARK